MATQRVTVPIRGMTCAGCVSTIEQALRQQDGVIWATVNFAAEEATVIADPSVVGVQRLAQLIRGLGFDVALPERKGLAFSSYVAGPLSRAWAIVAPSLAGIASMLFLVTLYLTVVTIAQGWQHATELLWGDRWLVGVIAAGFGVQIALFVRLRLMQRLYGERDLSGRLTAAGTGTSSVAMLACCAHHVTDLAPIIGLSAAATLLNQYRIPFMMLGIGVNLLGIILVMRQLQTIGKKVKSVALS